MNWKMWHLKTTTVVIYKAFCLDVEQGHMKGAPNETLKLPLCQKQW